MYIYICIYIYFVDLATPHCCKFSEGEYSPPFQRRLHLQLCSTLHSLHIKEGFIYKYNYKYNYYTNTIMFYLIFIADEWVVCRCRCRLGCVG